MGEKDIGNEEFPSDSFGIGEERRVPARRIFGTPTSALKVGKKGAKTFLAHRDGKRKGFRSAL